MQIKIEYCCDCDRETKNHCLLCGLALCSNCSQLNNGICSSCEEDEDNNDAEY